MDYYLTLITILEKLNFPCDTFIDDTHEGIEYRVEIKNGMFARIIFLYLESDNKVTVGLRAYDERKIQIHGKDYDNFVDILSDILKLYKG